MPIESAITLSDTDRAILRALLSCAPRPGSEGTRPCPDPSDHRATESEPVTLPSLLEALTAAGLDELDLPLWFAQPHTQHYIQARRALDEFLDEQSTRAARREGLELLRTLPAPTHAQHSASAASGPGSDPPDPRADASPSEPASARSLREMRLIATALLRAPLPTPARPIRSSAAAPRRSALGADTRADRLASPITGPSEGDSDPVCHGRPAQRVGQVPSLPGPGVSTPESAADQSANDTTPDALAELSQLLPGDLRDATFEEALKWAVSVVSEGPDNARSPPTPIQAPDTS
ncbi:MAG: hypothetical protein H6811_04040 [Phycisphaeraceae bacterium]|nr:hypothetical protein [Phycisphaeraceae bacterium]